MISVKNNQYSLSKMTILISLLIFITLISTHAVAAQSSDGWVQLGTAIVEQPTYYTVSYEKETDNGIVVKDVEDMPNQYVAEGASVGELSEAPYDDKYNFEGYYSGDETFDENSTINSDTVVTAKYTANTERNISADTEIGNVSYYAQGSTAFPADAVPTASYIETNLFDDELLSFNLGISAEDWVPEEDVNITVLLSIPIDISSYGEVFLYDEYGNSISCGTTVLSDNLYALLFTVNSLGDFHVTGDAPAVSLKSVKSLSLKSTSLLGADSGACTPAANYTGCLTFSSGGTTVTGTNGNCTVVTAADFNCATEIVDESASHYGAFYSSRDTLTSVTFPSTLTKIGKYAFSECTKLTGSLTIPNSVTTINDYAFFNCSGLTGSLTIPDSVTTIGYAAFAFCSGFTGSLTIPNSVTTIGNSAFDHCSGFTGSLTIPDSVTSIGSSTFSGCSGFTGSLTIPSSVTSIGGSAFSDCSGLTGSLTIPNFVTSIGMAAFSGCSGLTGSLTIPDSVTSIGSSAFADCSGFTGNLTLPNSISTINYRTFYNCSGLTGNLTIPNSVTSIGAEAFAGCSGFTGSLAIPDSVTTIERRAFENCSGLTGSLTIPNSVTSIGIYAFYNCSGFTGSLTIGNSVTSIGDYTFYKCSGFTGSLTIGNSVTSIGSYAFYNCSGFTGSLTIPNSVTSIKTDAFYNCSRLDGILFTNKTATVDKKVFTSAAPVYLYADSSWINRGAGKKVPFITTLSAADVNVDQGRSIQASFTTDQSSSNAYIPSVTWVASTPSALTMTSPTGKGVTANTITGNTVGSYVVTLTAAQAGSDIFGVSAVPAIPSTTFNVTVNIPSCLIFSADGTTVTGTDGTCTVVTAADFRNATTIKDGTSTTSGVFYSSRNTLTSVTFPSTLTKIGKYAFYYCTNLTGSLTIPDSVTSIGNNAFDYCSGFTGSLTIPNSVTSIGSYAFRNCRGLDGILFSNKTATVGSSAFTNAAPVYLYADSSWVNSGGGTKVKFITSLSAADVTVDRGSSVQASFTSDQTTSNAYIPSVTWVASTPSALTMTSPTGKSVTANTITGNTVGSYAVTLTAAQAGSDIFGVSAVPAIPSTTFNVTVNKGTCLTFSSDGTTVTGTDGTCTVVTAADFKNATMIADGASAWSGVFFSSRNTLTSVTFPSNLTKIGNYAFSNLSGLTGSLTIPSSVTSIGNQAFYGCSGFTGNLTIPNSVTSIGDKAFYNCSGFTGNLTIPNSMTSISNSAFANCSGLTGSLTIPNSVTSIEDWAFSGCSGLTGSLTIPSSVTSIGSYAFSNCRGFTGNLTIPNSVASINNGTFTGCSGLTGLTIPDSVTSIGTYVFYNCSGLSGNLTIPNSVTSIGEAAFRNCSGLNGILFTNKTATVGTDVFRSTAPVYLYADSSWINDGGGTKVPFITSLSAPNVTVDEGNSIQASFTTDQSTSNAYIPSVTWVASTPSALTMTSPTGKGVTTNTITGNTKGTYTVTLTAAQVGSDIFGAAAVPAIPDVTFTATVTGTCLTFSADGTTVTGTDGTCTVVTAADFKNATIIADGTSTTSGVFYSSKDTLTSVTFPSSLAKIGDYAFCNCKNLTGNLTIPNSVTSIGNYAFYYCSGLNGNLTIGNSVTSIGSSAFQYCIGLTGDLTIPNFVASVGSYAFNGCRGFNGNLTISNSLSVINVGTFDNCRGLTGSLTIPNSITIIDAYAFRNCINLSGNLTIPNLVTSIGNQAFYGCVGFKGSLTIPSSVASVGEAAFEYCSGLTGSLLLPSSITYIGQYAFFECRGFTGSLTIPPSITTIREKTFYYCSGLDGNLIIPSTITTIENGAFDYCSGFSGAIVIPASVTSVGPLAFGECNGVDGILFTNKTATIGANAFYNAAPVYLYADSSWINDGGGTKVPFITSLSAADITVKQGSSVQASFTSDQTQSNSYIPSVTWVASRPNALTLTSPTGKGITANTITGNTEGTYTVTLTAAQPGSEIFGTSAVPEIPSTTFTVSVINSCLTFSADGTTVTGTDGTCTVVTAADFKNATIIADGTSYTTGVFRNSRNTLTSVTFPSGLTKIGNNAFCDCTNLTGSLTIPNSVTSIGQGAFANCSGFTGSLTIPSSVISIGTAAFSGCSGFTGSLTIPSSVTSISNSAFGSCTGFTSLTIPNSVTSIETAAFNGCSGFTGSLTIPNSVTSIGVAAFQNCSGFTGNLIIPDSVTSIGSAAFLGCNRFNGILYKNKTATVGGGAFSNTAPVYCYADSSWINSGHAGTLRYFITSLSATDVSVDENKNETATITPDIAASSSYIPSMTWTSSDTSVATLANTSTGRGVMTNRVNGISDGTSTVTVTAAQVGSDIFGASVVPAIPAKTFNVRVNWVEVSPTGVDLRWNAMITIALTFILSAAVIIAVPKKPRTDKE